MKFSFKLDLELDVKPVIKFLNSRQFQNLIKAISAVLMFYINISSVQGW
jgi:hypothetical protein